METNFGYCGKEDDRAFFSSDERKWILRINRLKEKFPDFVEILRAPEENDGCVYCTFPRDWLKIAPPKNLSMTEEELAALSERFKASVLAQKQGG